MSKRTLYGWILLGLTVLVLIFTKGRTEISFVGVSLRALTSVILLAFTGIGVAIGVLLR
jgi:hypothetical protein